MILVRWCGCDGKNQVFGIDEYDVKYEELAIMACIEENDDLTWFQVEEVEYVSNNSKD